MMSNVKKKDVPLISISLVRSYKWCHRNTKDYKQLYANKMNNLEEMDKSKKCIVFQD